MTYDNPELQLAEEFLHHTGCHIFLTGKAGTGKTTFLHNIRKKTAKRMVVTAPTGVAAINAGGVTLHSFFQLPFGPFPPGSDPLARENHRLSKEKRNIIKSLDLLVIDEISMVRADLLDLVDMVLRRYRRFDIPFGGVQLLMIGDLHQLSPVVKEAEWQLLRPHYDSPYFFSCRALSQAELVPIELKHIYRQSDTTFIELLNRVRDNKLDAASLEQLNKRYIPDFSPADEEGYITLSTHNNSADAINATKLKELAGTSRHFNAELDGEFPEHIYPTAAALHLKVGAQVMFVKNDTAPEKRYFNGKIGRVVKMSEKNIEVSCPDDLETIVVERAKWENIEYTIDPENAEISQNTIGTFAQYPLKLAWAITIHKSQGLTFDRAIIDAQAAFAHGQVYVALSRCRTLEGMVLSAPLTPSAIKTDHTVNRFIKEAEQRKPTAEQLATATTRYQQRLLMDCFNFRMLGTRLGRLVSLINRYESVIQLVGAGDLKEIQQQTNKDICAVGENFQRQLHSLFSSELQPSEDPTITDRLKKAASYFQGKFAEILMPTVENILAETDNKEIRKQLNNSISQLREEAVVKLAAVSSCAHGFSPADYLRALSTAEIATTAPRPKAPSITYTEADVGHPELFDALKTWRKEKAATKGVQLFQIMHQKTLVQIAVHLPDNLTALKGIHGIGKKMAADYGEELIGLVGDYRKAHGITTVTLPDMPMLQLAMDAKKEKAAKEQVGDTKETTITLFRQGKTIAQIARERDLTTATIENHLAYYIEKGELEIQALVTDTDRELIESIAGKQENQTMREIRNAAGEMVSYGDIRFVLAYLRSKE
ncbi:helix-turn-helix domain-containing protein [Desulfopila aestuarii]|uniref:UvrD-like helicase C-terminal domain-containing protein n=1 Tax=Desulfopila aestuarii DSM 18488 TaxID=1121416 RepID=A0A1M7YGD3_9BACT|nr:helix-turn-helix domain-containing protein [Desulfopila aestuarii]SHO51690.1 UvrD-like helicase C-terminal domain-containing protein [Desulfopila aestuarii DSM 18488]